MPDPIPTPDITPEMGQAVSNAIVQSGASGLGPSTAPQPISVSAHGGDDPSITYDFTTGSDGKIYGKGDNPPGPTQHLTVKIRQFQGKWLVTSELTQTVNYTSGPATETTGLSSSGAQSNYGLDSDKDKDWSGKDGRSTEERNAERFDKFLPNDLLTAVRQSLWSLQAKKKLYQFEVDEGPDPRLLAAAALLVAGALMTLASLTFAESGTSAPSPSPSASAGGPVIGNIVSTFVKPTTTYTLDPPAPQGATYRWTNTNSCGTQTGQSTAVFVWNHPDGPGGCPTEDVHPANITVTVSGTASGATYNVSRSYPGGSAPNAIAAGTTNNPGGPVATATQIHATGEPLPIEGRSPNVPVLVAGLASLAGGGALATSRARARSAMRRARSA